MEQSLFRVQTWCIIGVGAGSKRIEALKMPRGRFTVKLMKHELQDSHFTSSFQGSGRVRHYVFKWSDSFTEFAKERHFLLLVLKSFLICPTIRFQKLQA